MPAHIPAGREDLWRRQAESDAELARLDAALKAAEKRVEALGAVFDRDDSIVEDAVREAERLHDAYCREVAVNDRIYSERLAGLTSHLDHDPTAPICPDCKGAGGPPGCDAHGACRTCRGWGREYREPIPVWSEQAGGWINPATGRLVDLLADQSPTAAEPYQPPAKDPNMPENTALAEAERIVAQAEQDHAFHNPHTPPGRVFYGPDGETPMGTYKTVDNGDGTTVMHIMTLHGWRELPETRANNGRKPQQPPTTPTKPNATPPSGAAAMSDASYGSLKARVLSIADNINEQQGPLQQAIGGLESVIADTQGATEDSQALDETLQMLMHAKQQCEEALGMLGQANDSATNAAAGLQ